MVISFAVSMFPADMTRAILPRPACPEMAAATEHAPAPVYFAALRPSNASAPLSDSLQLTQVPAAVDVEDRAGAVWEMAAGDCGHRRRKQIITGTKALDQGRIVLDESRESCARRLRLTPVHPDSHIFHWPVPARPLSFGCPRLLTSHRDEANG